MNFNSFWFMCFDFLFKILKSENENQASDYIIIGYCEPLVFNIHGYWVVPKVVGCFIMGILNKSMLMHFNWNYNKAIYKTYMFFFISNVNAMYKHWEQ
jgi:hypothetical protein